MKIAKKIVTLFLALVLCFNIGNINVKAAGASVTIALSASTVSIGGSVTATVTVSGSDVSQYDIYVTYNSSVLQFSSGSGAAQANGSGGTIRLVGGTGSTSLNFTAIANGSCYISTSGSEVYNINYEQVSITHAGANVTVATADTTESPATTEAGGEDSTTEEEEEDTRSSNCNLSDLQVSPGTLEPKFQAATTSYFVQLEEDATSIIVSAPAEDENASVSVSGGDSLQKGENIVKVTVTAENGAVKIYNIRVAVGEILEDAEVTIDGKTYRFVNDATDLEVPERFSATTIQYQEWELMAYESPNKKIVLVCLYDEDYEYVWFVYNQDTENFIPYYEYSSSFNRYIILPVPAGIPIPEGYVEAELSLKGNELAAYRSVNVADEDIYLVYAMNIDGDEGFYLYDAKEDAFMRYVPEQSVAAEPETATAVDATPLDAVDDNDTDTGFFTQEMLFYIMCGIGALCLLFLILTIVFAVKRKHMKQELEQAEDMIAHLTVEKENAVKSAVKPVETPVESPMLDIRDTTPKEREGHIDVIPIVKAEPARDIVKENAREEKQSAYDAFEKQSELINNKIKEDYDISLDSAFADVPSETASELKQGETAIDADKKEDSVEIQHAGNAGQKAVMQDIDHADDRAAAQDADHAEDKTVTQDTDHAEDKTATQDTDYAEDKTAIQDADHAEIKTETQDADSQTGEK